jgi:hypothetical protein
MILGWAAAMAAWNPDVLTGYNVFGFDEQYLWRRAEELRITSHESIQALSRLVEFDKPVVLEEKMLSSSAMGDNQMYIWSAFGRLQVDLFHYIKRSFSLPAYKLDYVCQHFMSGKCGGIDTSGSEWLVKTKNTDDVVIGRYVVLLDETGDAVVEKLKVVGVKPKEALVLEAPVEDLEDLKAAAADVVKWATVKDDVSPQDIFAFHRDGGPSGRARVAALQLRRARRGGARRRAPRAGARAVAAPVGGARAAAPRRERRRLCRGAAVDPRRHCSGRAPQL